MRLRFADQIGGEKTVAIRLLPVEHDGFSDAGQGFQGGGDFLGLDPLAADFHLPVDPAEELDDAVGAPASEVAGAVDAGARA